MLDVAELTGHVLHLLDLAIEPLTHGVGDQMLVVGHDVVDVSAGSSPSPSEWVSTGLCVA